MNQGLRRRYNAEKRFRRLGVTAILIALSFLTFLFISIISNGYTAFRQTYSEIDVNFAPEVFQHESLSAADYPGLVKSSLRSMFPEVDSRIAKKRLYQLVSPSAGFALQDMVQENPKLIGNTLSV